MNEFSKSIMRQFYSQKDQDGVAYETTGNIIDRVMSLVPLDYANRRELKKALISFDFVPSSPTLMNAGTDLGQLSACFVLPLEDSIPEIYDTIKNAAIVHKTGGGTGFSFSNIRRQGDLVRSTGGIASGPLSFMNVLNASTDTIKQGGKRRGANMAVLRIDHPSIYEFIDCKKDETAFTNFNISVAITDEFIEALNGHGNGGNFGFKLINPRNGEVDRVVNSREIYSKIVEAAWERGDPGLIFIDRINKLSPTVKLIEATNPCGEIPLLPYEACNLGAVNVGHCVSDGKIDYRKIERLSTLATDFLNFVIDNNKLPIEEISVATRATRKIGLGLMGFADLLFQVRVRYGSEESIEIAKKVMCVINCASKLESTILYSDYYNNGQSAVGFDNIFLKDDDKKEKYFQSVTQNILYYPNVKECFGHANFSNEDDKFITKLWLRAYEDQRVEPVINLCRTTAAPTGTTGILADSSGGVEPIFFLLLSRLVNGKDKHLVFNKYFGDYLNEIHFPKEESELLMKELQDNGSIQHCAHATAEMKNIFVCAHDIPPIEHLKIMEAFQSYIDNSVSKTINLPNTATIEDVKEIYKAAMLGKVKGLTVYRDGCRSIQVLTSGKETVQEEKVTDKNEKLFPRTRERTLKGSTTCVRTGCGKLYISVNQDSNGLAEVFTGDSSGCHAQSAVLSRLISIALRSGIDEHEIIDQLQSVACTTAQRNPSSECNSCPDAIARVMLMCMDEAENLHLTSKKSKAMDPVPTARLCPSCGEPLVSSMGCNSNCISCGWNGCNQ